MKYLTQKLEACKYNALDGSLNIGKRFRLYLGSNTTVSQVPIYKHPTGPDAINKTQNYLWLSDVNKEDMFGICT